MSNEYVASIVLLGGALLKIFGVEMDSGVLEGLVAGVLALWVAIRRYQKGDITIVGVRK